MLTRGQKHVQKRVEPIYITRTHPVAVACDLAGVKLDFIYERNA